MTCDTTRYWAARYALPGRDFHPLDRANLAWRTRCYSDPESNPLVSKGSDART